MPIGGNYFMSNKVQNGRKGPQYLCMAAHLGVQLGKAYMIGCKPIIRRNNCTNAGLMLC